jgi:hypothetical protein
MQLNNTRWIHCYVSTVTMVTRSLHNVPAIVTQYVQALRKELDIVSVPKEENLNI